ncbi:MAG: hypothetical protein AABY14_02695 [Nanoarchaeota archaeon]
MIKKMIRKNAQLADVLGISVIIVIVLIFLTFYLRTEIFQKPSTPQKEYITSQYANDVIDVLLRTNSEKCKGEPGLSFKELIQECEGDVEDGKIDEYCEETEDNAICTYAEQQITNILDSYLKDVVGMDYYFQVCTVLNCEGDSVLEWKEIGRNEENFEIGTSCPASKRSKTYQLPSTRSGGNIFIKLDICL